MQIPSLRCHPSLRRHTQEPVVEVSNIVVAVAANGISEARLARSPDAAGIIRIIGIPRRISSQAELRVLAGGDQLIGVRIQILERWRPALSIRPNALGLPCRRWKAQRLAVA